MKLSAVNCAWGLIFLLGCQSPPPAAPDFGQVPGPSKTTATLPPAEASPAPASAETGKATSGKAKEPLVTPDTSLRGKVSRYNEAGRFMVLEFPVSRLPASGRTLFVYRSGLKVGEAKVTGPQRDDRTVADLVNGVAQVGDEVREQ